MEREYRNIKNSIGMFDLLKGIGMLIVVFGHTVSGYAADIMQNNNLIIAVLVIVYVTIAEIVIPIFLVISGYGFRKRPIKKCIKQQINLMLKPYLYVMIIDVCIYFCIHYACFHYWPASMIESLRVLGGFLFALPTAMTLFSVQFFSCGVVWYIFAMFLGWIFLDILMTVFSEKYWNIAVIFTMILGWTISLFGNLPFCLIQGLVATGYLYLGYKIKKSKAFFIKFSKSAYLAMIVFIFTEVAIIAGNRSIDNVAEAEWSFGPISMLLSALLAYIMIYLGLSLNNLECTGINILRIIGKNSLYIFCIHTIELSVFPWYLVLPEANSFTRCIVILILRFAIIFGVCFALNFIKRKNIHRKKSIKLNEGRIV